MIEDLYIPVQRSLLSADALAERLLPDYDLPAGATCHFWHQSINDTYLVRAGDTRLMLRVAPANRRSREQMLAEIDLLRYLGQHGILTPQPVALRDGAYLRTLAAPEGPRHAVLFTFVPGVPYNATTTDGYRYGQAIAQFHAMADGYVLDDAVWRFEAAEMIDRPLELLRPWFADRPDDYATLLENAARLRETVESLPRVTPCYGICHGDLNDNNIHLIGEDAWALLDFEYVGYGWRVFDIATFFNNQLTQRGRTEETRGLLDAFLKGYQSERRLSAAELAALPAFVLLRQLWIWGVSVTNQAIVGRGLHEQWMFEICLPIFKAWAREPW